MYIFLGNLSILDLENRCGVKFDEKDKEWLENHRQSNTDNISKDKFHIFDIPFSVKVGSKIVDQLIEILKKYNNEKEFDEKLIICTIEGE